MRCDLRARVRSRLGIAGPRWRLNGFGHICFRPLGHVDHRAAQPAIDACVGGEESRAWQDPFAAGGDESEFDPLVRQSPRGDPSQWLAVVFHWRGHQPTADLRIHWEEARARQDALAALRLEAELNPPIGDEPGYDPALDIGSRHRAVLRVGLPGQGRQHECEQASGEHNASEGVWHEHAPSLHHYDSNDYYISTHMGHRRRLAKPAMNACCLDVACSQAGHRSGAGCNPQRSARTRAAPDRRWIFR